ncbi:MAG: glycosyltransferase family 1 protein [Candidatus Fermentibacter sp.]|nr:glycosyltransferase family 1 protein [Candidatus Fermentibacter sp.]
MNLALQVDFDPSRPTGIGRYGIELSRSLEASGEKPTVWIESGRLAAWKRLGIGTGPVRVLHRPGRISSRIGPGVFSALDGVDLVHSFGSTVPSIHGGRTKRSTMIHDLGPFLHPEMKEAGDTAAWRARISDAAGCADCLLVNSRTTMDDLLGIFPLAEGRVFLTPPGVDHLPPPSDPGRKPPGGGHVLMVGLIEPRKNLGRVFEAWAMLEREAGPGGLPNLVVAGADGFRAGEIRDIPARLGIAGSVRFEGYVTERRLAELYSGASILVHAAVYEGFGFTLPEAFSYGLPVAASGRASIREMFSSACDLFDPSDPVSIATAVKLCMDRGVPEEQLAERRRILCKYTWANCAEATMKAFRTVTGA